MRKISVVFAIVFGFLLLQISKVHTSQPLPPSVRLSRSKNVWRVDSTVKAALGDILPADSKHIYLSCLSHGCSPVHLSTLLPSDITSQESYPPRASTPCAPLEYILLDATALLHRDYHHYRQFNRSLDADKWIQIPTIRTRASGPCWHWPDVNPILKKNAGFEFNFEICQIYLKSLLRDIFFNFIIFC